MKYFFSMLLLCLSGYSYTQSFNHNVFMVSLTDKDNSPYSVFHPQDFLSQRAIQRRTTQQITIDIRDLPLDPVYIKKIEDLGVDIHLKSKGSNSQASFCSCSTAFGQTESSTSYKTTSTYSL